MLIYFFLLMQVSCKEGERVSNSEQSSITLLSSELEDYNSLTVSVRFQGSTTEDYLGNDLLSFHTDNLCLSASLGSSLVNQFKSSGLLVELPTNQAVDLYVKSAALNTCVFLQNFVHPTLIPSEPTFSLVVPASPSRLTTAPGIFGNALPISSTIEFFSDSLCTSFLASGSAINFNQIGIPVQVSMNSTTPIYARTRDALGSVSGCVFMSDFTHSDSYSYHPELLSISPLSPSNQSFNPTLRVSTTPGSTFLGLYSDSGCQNLLVQGSPSDFSNLGFAVSLPQNSTSRIYARSVDASGVPSVCTLLTSFTHDSLPPNDPSYLSSNPSSPTNQTTLPRIIGAASADTADIIFYNSSLCLNSIGSGIRNDFVNSGIVVNVTANSSTDIYIRAFDSSNNGSDCQFLTSYIHNTIPPGSPVFGATNPESPTNLNANPLITGTAEPRTTHLSFFKDENCTMGVGDGSVANFENSGILLNLDENTTTSIYVQSQDQEGNISECFFLSSYLHFNGLAPGPIYISTFPSSPSNTSTTPTVVGSVDNSISTIGLYDDSNCTNLVNSGTRPQYTSSGIVFNVSSNSTNNIYAKAVDVFGNNSACVLLTTYIHNNVPPLDPIYTSISPVSPNNQSSTPIIFGDSLYNPASQIPPSRVDFFDSSSCVSLLGQGSPGVYSTTGVLISVPENTETAIYGKSYDAAGNESNCTFLSFYTHNTLVPAAPSFSNSNPTSPSYNSSIRIFGSYGTSLDFMNRVSLGIYSDSSCTNLLTSSDPNLLTSTGVPITVSSNTVTSLYGRSFNEVGTPSACQFLTNFTHYNLPPSNLTVQLNSNGSVRLNWSPDTFSNPTPKYSVERSLQSGGPYTSLMSEQISNSYIDSDISNSTQYFYRVYSTNSTGRSQYSGEVDITTSASSAVTVNNLSATANDSAITLSWSGFPQNMTYRIFRSLQFGGPFTDLGITTSSASYQNVGLSNGQEYFYFVKASNPSGETVQSNIASAIPRVIPNPPTDFVLSPLFASKECSGAPGLRMSWAPSQYFTSFNIYRGMGKFSTNSVGTVGVPFFDHCSYPNDEILYYKVVSTWAGLDSVQSNLVGIFTSASPNLVLSPGNNQIQLSWAVPGLMPGYSSGDLKYSIYKSFDPDKNFIELVSDYTSTSYVDNVSNGAGAYYYVQSYVIDNDGDKIFMGFPTTIRSAKAATNPVAPSNLNLVYFDSEMRAQLDWVSPTHFNEFRLYRSLSAGGPYTFVQSVSNSFLPSAPLQEGLNHFRLTAVWGGVESTPTNIVTFRHAPILGLNLTRQPNSLNLTWANVSGVQDYIISRSNSVNGPFVDINTSLTNSYVDNTVSGATGYYYRIRARFSDLTQGQNSAVIAGQTSNSLPPADVSLTVVGNTQIKVDWPRVTGATSYQVRTAFSSVGPYSLVGSTTLNTFNIFGLIPQSEYYVKVTAIVSGLPNESNPVSAYTFVPTSAPIGIVGDNQVTISWTEMPNAVDYDVERSTDGINFSTISTNYTMTNYTDSTATNGQVYFYRIRTEYLPLSLLSSVSIGFSPGRKPLPPSNLHAENNGTATEIDLKWTDVSGRTSFNIYSSTTSGVYGVPIQSSLSAYGTRITGLNSGTTYYFRVTSLNGTNESAPSNEISITPTSSPAKPNVEFSSSNVVSVTWSALPGASSYTLLRSIDGVNFNEVVTALVSTNFLDTVMDTTKTYYYMYQPYTSTGSEMSLSQVSDPVNLSVIPLTPSGLHLVAQTTSTVELNWSSVPSITNYEILRSTSQGGPYNLIATEPMTSGNYLDSSVTLGQSYYYVVRTINSSGVRSSFSNEVSVNLVSGPTNLIAMNGTSSIDLSWDSVPGATSYEVLRSLSSSGPFGLIFSTSNLMASDTNVLTAIEYHYVVQAVYADGRRSAQSTVSSIVRDGSLRLQIPIELTDTAMSSSQNQNMIFERTQTSFNTNDYDGVSSIDFQVIATNFDVTPRSVGITNQSNIVLDYITVPANTIVPTLFQGSVSIASGNYKLRLELEQTASDGQLSVLVARLLINQVNASKTRIYYPLLNSDESATNVDQDTFAYSTSNTSFHDFINAKYFTRRATHLDKIESYNGWELEALVSSENGAEGVIALQNVNTNQILPVTETRFVNSQVKMASIPFNEGTLYFRSTNENHNYRLVMRCEYNCTSGSVRVHKAGLWVKLQNLNKVSLIYRVTSLKRSISNASVFSDQRVNLNLNLFSSVSVYYQALTQTDSLSQGDVKLQYHNQTSGDTGLIDLVSSSISVNSNLVQLQRTGVLTGLPVNQHFMTYVQSSMGEIQLRSSDFLIETSP